MVSTHSCFALFLLPFHFAKPTHHRIPDLKPIPEEEKSDYTHILQVYLPTLIIAYASALTYAAHYLGPETLLRAFEVATIVADEDANPELQAAFAKAGRMGEFVTTMAMASRALLNINQDLERKEKAAKVEAKEGGKKRKRVVRKRSGVKKRGWMGETADLWDPTKMVLD